MSSPITHRQMKHIQTILVSFHIDREREDDHWIRRCEQRFRQFDTTNPLQYNNKLSLHPTIVYITEHAINNPTICIYRPSN